MSKRSFMIPLVPVLGLTLGTGCGPSLMGKWELLEIDGEKLEGSYTYGGCVLDYSTTGHMEFEEKDGLNYTGEIKISWTYTFGSDCYDYSGKVYSGSYNSDIEGKKIDKRTFEIEAEDFELEMDCTLDGDELLCDDDAGYELLFGRE